MTYHIISTIVSPGTSTSVSQKSQTTKRKKLIISRTIDLSDRYVRVRSCRYMKRGKNSPSGRLSVLRIIRQESRGAPFRNPVALLSPTEE